VFGALALQKVGSPSLSGTHGIASALAETGCGVEVAAGTLSGWCCQVRPSSRLTHAMSHDG
jgi:hypothetical protein